MIYSVAQVEKKKSAAEKSGSPSPPALKSPRDRPGIPEGYTLPRYIARHDEGRER